MQQPSVQEFVAGLIIVDAGSFVPEDFGKRVTDFVTGSWDP